MLLGKVFRLFGGPDWEGLGMYAVGVPLGLGVDLPRTPAVFPAKTKWLSTLLAVSFMEHGVLFSWPTGHADAITKLPPTPLIWARSCDCSGHAAAITMWPATPLISGCCCY